MAQYGTTIEAEAYFGNKLHIPAWVEADEDQRNRALREASIRIDQLNFRGAKTDSTQALEWPRINTIYEDTEVPQRVKDATFEVAYALLDGAEPDLEQESLSVSSEGYSAARTTYARDSAPEHFAAGIPSSLAWKYLKPLLGDVRGIKLRRVS
jgi:hypothetical protein